MNSHATNSLKQITNLAVNITSLLGIVLLAAVSMNAQQLQQGISVEMAPSRYAKAMPAADQLDAWIFTVTADGKLFFGITPVTSEGFANEMVHASHHSHQNLYIKADARARYSDVESALKAAHALEADAPVMLTAQQQTPAPGKIVPPSGLEVSIASGALTLHRSPRNWNFSGDGSAALNLNNQSIEWDALQGHLKQLFQGHSENVVRLKAAGSLHFADVAHAIDISRSTGAKVVLAMPTI